MQTKWIEEIKFVHKATYKTNHWIWFIWGRRIQTCQLSRFDSWFGLSAHSLMIGPPNTHNHSENLEIAKQFRWYEAILKNLCWKWLNLLHLMFRETYIQLFQPHSYSMNPVYTFSKSNPIELNFNRTQSVDWKMQKFQRNGFRCALGCYIVALNAQ